MGVNNAFSLKVLHNMIDIAPFEHTAINTRLEYLIRTIMNNGPLANDTIKENIKAYKNNTHRNIIKDTLYLSQDIEIHTEPWNINIEDINNNKDGKIAKTIAKEITKSNKIKEKLKLIYNEKKRKEIMQETSDSKTHYMLHEADYPYHCIEIFNL